MPAWDDIPEERAAVPAPADGGRRRVRRARRRPGRPARRRDRRSSGYGDNTLVFYIWGDNGSSGEGQNGTISELLAQNGIPTHRRHAHPGARRARRPRRARHPEGRQPVPRRLGLGGQHPYKGMKLLASHLGGTRNPMAVRWPARIAPDADAAHASSTTATTSSPRSTRWSGSPRRGWSTASRRTRSTASASPTPSTTPDAPGRLRTQYFEVMGSRAIYHDGWMASAFGPRLPWVPGLPPGIARLDPRPGRVGAVQPRRGLVPGPRPRRRRCPTSWRR